MKPPEIKDAEYAVDRLFCWADDEEHPSTYLVFLVLIGRLEADFAKRLGYLEADLLAKALAAWASYPSQINALIDKHQQEFL